MYRDNVITIKTLVRSCMSWWYDLNKNLAPISYRDNVITIKSLLLSCVSWCDLNEDLSLFLGAMVMF